MKNHVLLLSLVLIIAVSACTAKTSDISQAEKKTTDTTLPPTTTTTTTLPKEEPQPSQITKVVLPVGTTRVFEVNQDGTVYTAEFSRATQYKNKEVHKKPSGENTLNYYYDEDEKLLKRQLEINYTTWYEYRYKNATPEPTKYPLHIGKIFNETVFGTGESLIIKASLFGFTEKSNYKVIGIEKIAIGNESFWAAVLSENYTLDYGANDNTYKTITEKTSWISSELGTIKYKLKAKDYVKTKLETQEKLEKISVEEGILKSYKKGS